MKKIFLFSVLVAGFLVVSANASAQNDAAKVKTQKNAVVYHHEVFAGYGVLSTNDILAPTFKVLLTIFTLGGYNEQNMSMSGALMVGYKYRFNKVASLGATYAFGSASGDAFKGNTPWGKATSQHHTFAAECDFRYLTRKVVTLYSTVGLGATYYAHTLTPVDTNEKVMKDCIIHPNFHISLLGAKLGTYRAGGFVELGVGYKGILNFGAYVRF